MENESILMKSLECLYILNEMDEKFGKYSKILLKCVGMLINLSLNQIKLMMSCDFVVSLWFNGNLWNYTVA